MKAVSKYIWATLLLVFLECLLLNDIKMKVIIDNFEILKDHPVF